MLPRQEQEERRTAGEPASTGARPPRTWLRPRRPVPVPVPPQTRRTKTKTASHPTTNPYPKKRKLLPQRPQRKRERSSKRGRSACLKTANTPSAWAASQLFLVSLHVRTAHSKTGTTAVNRLNHQARRPGSALWEPGYVVAVFFALCSSLPFLAAVACSAWAEHVKDQVHLQSSCSDASTAF